MDVHPSFFQVMELHRRRYPGAAKEYAILYELLYKIEAPSRLAIPNELTEKLKAETGIDISIRVAGFLLYFYLEKDKTIPFAQMDLSKSTLPGNALNNSLSGQKIDAIFNTTSQFIEDNRGKSTILNDWIRQYFKGKTQAGILQLMEAMEIGEERSITMNGGNDLSEKVEQIFDYLFHAEAVVYKMSILLNNGATMDISPEEKLFSRAVDDAAYQAVSLDDFIELLNTNYEKLLRIRDKEKGHKYKGYSINIYILEGSKVSRSTANLLHRMRRLRDTKKALQRLLLLGVIDDYYEENNKFIINFTKKEKNEYEEALRAYIARFETSEGLKMWMRKAYETPVIEEEHPSLIAKETQETRLTSQASVMDYLRVLLRFEYAQLVPQRANIARRLTEGYHTVAELVMDNSPAFFYDKKYAHSAHTPNLQEDTSQGSLIELETVWKYMDAVGMDNSGLILLNIRQLKTSSELMLEQHPNHPTFRLLRAFCLFYLETEVKDDALIISDETNLKSGANDFIEGFYQFKNLYGMSAKDLEAAVNQFQEKTIRYKSELKNIMNQAAELLYLELRNRWLRQFKQKLYG